MNIKTWSERTPVRPGGYCETSDVITAMTAEIAELRQALAKREASTEPVAYALLRNGKVEGVERTIQCARMWVNAEIVPLFMDAAGGAQKGEAPREIGPNPRDDALFAAMHQNNASFSVERANAEFRKDEAKRRLPGHEYEIRLLTAGLGALANYIGPTAVERVKAAFDREESEIKAQDSVTNKQQGEPNA